MHTQFLGRIAKAQKSGKPLDQVARAIKGWAAADGFFAIPFRRDDCSSRLLSKRLRGKGRMGDRYVGALRLLAASTLASSCCASTLVRLVQKL